MGDADEAIQLQEDMEAAKNQLASALARNAALGLELQKARDQIRCMSGLADTVAAADAGGDGNGKTKILSRLARQRSPRRRALAQPSVGQPRAP